MMRTLSKILAGALVYYIGMGLGGALTSLVGFTRPPLPAGTDEATLAALLVPVSIVVAAMLAFISVHLPVKLAWRTLILAGFAWVTLGVNTAIEATFFLPTMASLGYSTIVYGVASFLCGSVIAWQFRPEESKPEFHIPGALRLVAAVLVFPAVYLTFGMIVEPFIREYYEQHLIGLQIPSLGVLILVQLLRSVLYLAACSPIVLVWRGRFLFPALGLALFLFVGGLPLLQASWFPPTMRIAHSLEIAADSFVYAGALVLLLRKRQAEPVAA